MMKMKKMSEAVMYLHEYQHDDLFPPSQSEEKFPKGHLTL